MGKILNKKTIFKNHPLCRSNRFQKEIPKHLKKYAEVHDSIINFDPCTDFCWHTAYILQPMSSECIFLHLEW